MFDIELMRFNPEAPSFLLTLITALFAFFLSAIIAITYEYTTKGVFRRAHFIQSLALIGIVAAMILQAIGESVAVGLGIIGALSIIRFRTSLSDPRNITFMFASLGSGIACGVMAFGIALTGTTVFCVGSLILRHSSLGDANEFIGVLKLRVPRMGDHQQLIEKELAKLCRSFELDQLKYLDPKQKDRLQEIGPQVAGQLERKELQELVYLVCLKNNASAQILESRMMAIDNIDSFRINFQNKESKL